MKYTKHQCRDSYLNLGTTHGYVCPWEWPYVLTSELLLTAHPVWWKPSPHCLCHTRTETTYKSSRFCTWGEAEQAIEFHHITVEPLWFQKQLEIQKGLVSGPGTDWVKWTLNWADLKGDYIFLVYPATFCHRRLTKSSSLDITHSTIWLICLPLWITLSLTEPVRDKP